MSATNPYGGTTDTNLTRVNIDPNAPLNPDPNDTTLVPLTAADESTEDYEEEIGATGTMLISGFLADVDYNPELEGTQRIKVFDQMRKGDATVRLGLAGIKMPLTAAQWYIKPPKGKNDDEEITTFVRQQLFENPNFSFTELLRKILTFCDFGASHFEKVFYLNKDGKVAWRKFAQRLPQTIYRYTLADGKTPGITQILPTGGNAYIPQWKLATFVNEMEGSNYEGFSFLRPAHKAWWYKDLYYKIDAMATERQGLGIPVVTSPPAALEDDKKKAINMAKNLHANQYAHINLPEGFKFEFMDMKAKGIKDPEAMIKHYNREILKAFGLPFMDTGESAAGSQQSTDAQKEFFYQQEKYLARIVQEGLQKAIHELVDLNYTIKEDQYPSLEFGNIGSIDFQKFSRALRDLVESGTVVPDDDLERHVRSAMELPAAMSRSDEQDVDPEMRRIPLPQAALDPNASNVKPRQPIRYQVPAGKGKQQTYEESESQALVFAENLLTMKEAIEQELATRQHAY